MPEDGNTIIYHNKSRIRASKWYVHVKRFVRRKEETKKGKIPKKMEKKRVEDLINSLYTNLWNKY